MVPQLITVLGSQPAGDVSHKSGGRLPLLSASPAVTPATLKRAATNFAAWWAEARWVWTVCLRLLPDLNPGPTAPEFSTLTTRLPSQRSGIYNRPNINTLSTHSKQLVRRDKRHSEQDCTVTHTKLNNGLTRLIVWLGRWTVDAVTLHWVSHLCWLTVCLSFINT